MESSSSQPIYSRDSSFVPSTEETDFQEQEPSQQSLLEQELDEATQDSLDAINEFDSSD